jgi:hypothetical protein
MSCRPSGRIISPPLSIRSGENGKLYFVLPADAQQCQSNKIRNYLIFVSRSSAVVSPTLCEKESTRGAAESQYDRKENAKKIPHSIERAHLGTLTACDDRRSIECSRAH